MLTKEELLELNSIKDELLADRADFDREWQDIITYIGLAYNRWPQIRKRAEGEEPTPKYILTDTTASQASDTLANGVEGYACSSSKPWFDYAIESLKEGVDAIVAMSLLQKVKSIAYKWLQKSNFYPVFRSLIRSGCDLGTGGIYFSMDEKSGLPMFSPLHLADLCIMNDEYSRADTIFRRFYLTKKEAIKHFGKERIEKIKVIKDCDRPRQRFIFWQLVSPVLKWDFDVKGEGDWLSIYWSEDDKEHTLREDRLKEKPFAVFRWEEPVYGGEWGVDSPGQLSLPAMRFVNVLTEDMITLSELSSKGLWKKTKGLKVNFKAGGVTALESGQDFALTQATGDLAWLAEHISYYRAVINDCYKTNLFLTLTYNIDRTKTATEVAGLTQERETLMQSFWSRLSTQIFEPLHEWLFRQILLSGKVEDITMEELQAIEDMEMRIDYVSPAYMAQKRSFELGPSMEWMNDMIQLAQVNPNILDKINFDTFADLDAEIRNARSEIVITSEDAQKARDIRSQIQAQANQNALQQEALKNVSDAYGKLAKGAEPGSVAEQMMGGNKENAG